MTKTGMLVCGGLALANFAHADSSRVSQVQGSTPVDKRVELRKAFTPEAAEIYASA